MFFLVINSGSSSIKAKLFTQQTLKEVYHAHVDGIGLKSCKFIEGTDREKPVVIKNHREAIEYIVSDVKQRRIIKSGHEINGIGHRVVHGGSEFTKSAFITPEVISAIKKLNKLAPLHNPANLLGISACNELFPDTQQIAVFDTSFHTTIPQKAFLYALPYSLYEKDHIRRYGFHGTSHAYVSRRAIELLKQHKKPWKRIISCHLGNGCSITAIKNGKSVDTSMGFTPLAGIMMGTRSGDIDPSIPIYLIHEKKYSLSDIEKLLNHESGLKGLSELSSDMRDLRQASLQGNKRAQLVIDTLTYQIIKYVGAYIGVLGGLDGLIFTGGMGEKAWYIRRDAVNAFSFLGMKLMNFANRHNRQIISSPFSRQTVLVIETNEEQYIAKEIKSLFVK